MSSSSGKRPTHAAAVVSYAEDGVGAWDRVENELRSHLLPLRDVAWRPLSAAASGASTPALSLTASSGTAVTPSAAVGESASVVASTPPELDANSNANAAALDHNDNHSNNNTNGVVAVASSTAPTVVTSAVVVQAQPQLSPTVDVDIVFVKQDALLPNVPANRHLQPYLWLYVLACESADHYKKAVRPRLRAWVKDRLDKQHQWAIIYVQAAPSPPAAAGAPGAPPAVPVAASLASRLTMQRTVWSRLRSDFRRENRCVKIRIAGAVSVQLADSDNSARDGDTSSDGEADDSEMSQQSVAPTAVAATSMPASQLAAASEPRAGLASSLSVPRPTGASSLLATLAIPGITRRGDSDVVSDADQWAELTHIVREAFGICFREALVAYEDDLRKLDSQRAQPGWNVSLFYAIKEGLAFTYERAGMLREALKQYIELELLLLNKFEQLDRVATKTSSLDASLLDMARKDHSGAILENKMSRLELLQYTLGREILLLLSLAEPREATMRVVRFVRAMSRQFAAHDPPLPPYHAVCWAYSTYLSVADEMERNLRPPAVQYHFLADLRALACDMLSRLRPLVYADSATKAASAVTHWHDRTARDALATPAAYNAFFVQRTGAAAQLYIDAKRPRHAVRMQVAMANALLTNPPEDVVSKDRGVDLFHAVLARLDADGWHDAYLQVALQLAAAQRHAGSLHASTQTIATLVALAARSRQLAASPSCLNQWELLIDVARSDKLERNVEAPFAALGVLSATLGEVNQQGALPRGSHVTLRCAMRGCALQRVTFDEVIVEFSRVTVNDDAEGAPDTAESADNSDNEGLTKTNSIGAAADDDDDDGGATATEDAAAAAAAADAEASGSAAYKARAKARGDYQLEKVTLTANGVSIGTRRDPEDIFELRSAQPINMISSWRVTRVAARVGHLLFVGDHLNGLAVFDVVPSRLNASIEVPAPVVLVTVGAPQFVYAELHTKSVPFVSVSVRVEVQSKRRVSNASTKLAVLDFADVAVRARADDAAVSTAVETEWRATCKRGRIEISHPSDPDAVLPRGSVVMIPISLQPKSIPPCTRTLHVSWTLVKSSGEVFKRRSHRTVTFNAPFEIVARVPRDGILADAVVLNILVKSLIDVPLVLTSAVLRAVGSASPHVRSAPQSIGAGGSGSYAFLVQRTAACEAVFEVAFDAPDGLSRTFVAPPMQLPAHVPALYSVAVSARNDDVAHVGDVVTLRIELRQAPPTGAASRALVEVEVAPETWIVGGWRARHHDVPGDGTACVIELPCVPRVAGRVPMPVVSVEGRAHGDGVVVVSGRRTLAFNAHRPAPTAAPNAQQDAQSTPTAVAATSAATGGGATTELSATASAAAVAAGGE